MGRGKLVGWKPETSIFVGCWWLHSRDFRLDVDCHSAENCQVLQGRIMTFVNQIAEIIHGVVDEFHGVPPACVSITCCNTGAQVGLEVF